MLRLWGFHEVQRKGPVNRRPYLRYVVAVGPRPDTGGQGWKVNRRYSQFIELVDELTTQHASALERSGALLPPRVRFPSSLQAEGRERLPALQLFLSRLMEDQVLRRCEPLLYFLNADRDSARRRLWAAAVGRRLSADSMLADGPEQG